MIPILYLAVLALWLLGWARVWCHERPAAGITWQGCAIVAVVGILWPLALVVAAVVVAIDETIGGAA